MKIDRSRLFISTIKWSHFLGVWKLFHFKRERHIKIIFIQLIFQKDKEDILNNIYLLNLACAPQEP